MFYKWYNIQIRMSGTVRIPLFYFMPWFEQKLDQKHSPLLQTLKTLFLTFSTLIKQLITIYMDVKTQLEKQQSELLALGQTVIDTSVQILMSMTQHIPICLDLSFCQNFAHQFEGKLTLLCSYYHSLSHIEQDSNANIRKEKQKIVDGINMLYLITGDIKEETKEVVYFLKMVSDYKKLFGKKLTSIQTKLDQIMSEDDKYEDFEKMPEIQKRQVLFFLFKQQQQIDQNLQKFVEQYLDLIASTCETQIQLQNILQEPIRICNELKNKKKILNHMMQEPNWNLVSRQLNLLLKVNFFSKQIRKTKVQEFISFLKIISLKKQQFIESSFDFQKMQNKIKQLLEATVENLKEFDKVDKVELVELINASKEKLSNQQTKKIAEIFSQYQYYIYKYYKINEQIKSLDRFVQTIVSKQLKIKVKLVLS